MKKILRIVGIIVVIVLIIGAIVASTNAKPSTAELVWDQKTTIGNINAKNHFVIYSDLVCPYCVAFENAIVEHEQEFQDYIAENDILVEVRLSDFLYEYGESNPIHSRYSAIATYCARDEGKFWDYYNQAISSVWNDFFKDNGKAGFIKLNKTGPEYWLKIGEKANVGGDFESCVKDEKPLEEIEANAAKTAKNAYGMPYFKFNNYTNSGFDPSWGWDYVKMYFEAGLES